MYPTNAIFTGRILRGDPIPVFNHGEMERDFTYIDDIAAGVIAAVDRIPGDDGVIKPGGSQAPHAIYNLGNSRPEPLLKVLSIIEEACGRRAVLDMQPMQPGDVPRTFALERAHDGARDLSDFAAAELFTFAATDHGQALGL